MGRVTADAVAVACFPLTPWSGRISGGGITLGDRFWPLPQNRPPDVPLHGDGWESPWTVVEHTDTRLELSLRSRRLPPFDYRATMVYAIGGDTLTIELAMEHRGAETVPYGIGLHPWFPRTPGTRLTAPATEVWLEDERHLPTAVVPVSARPDWDFATRRPLPDSWVCNAFDGWTREARIDWEESGIALDIAADAALPTYLLYAPSPDAGFFCFEPVSHPMDAHNWPGRPGLVELRKGERLASSCSFTVSRRRKG
ncbi:MAG: aldose 1-epimerase [Geminicoccaceae bacterium]